MPSLSVCLIVKNEERHLARCLASIRDLADEIVVVDTGSSDRTVEIAQAHGARVCHFTWQDDFSLAKNFSIEQATGDWILSIDADESIAVRDHAVIRETLERSDLDAVLVPQRHYLTEGVVLIGWQPCPGGYDEGRPYAGYIDVACRRLFRNEPRLRFRNRVHEELVSTDAKRPLRDGADRWVIHHFGKLAGPEALKAKGEAYLRIGLRKVEDHPRSPQAHYELGVQYAELDRPLDAIRAFERALALAPRFRDAQLHIGLCHATAGQHRQALKALRAAARTLPQYAADIALSEGNAHRELGELDAAAQAFTRAIAGNPDLVTATLNLALVYLAQQRTGDALACVDRGLQRSPGHNELRVLRGRLRFDLGDDAGALADFEATADDTRSRRWQARILVKQRRFAEARQALTAESDHRDAALLALRGAIALGLGEVDEAITQLQSALELQPSDEAALNLATALTARGDRPAALVVVAGALRLAPDHPALIARFVSLAGDTFRTPRPDAGGGPLTIVFYQPLSIEFDGHTPRTRGLGGTESAIVYLAEALAAQGHRCIVLNNCAAPIAVSGVEYARWETLAQRCLDDRPDVLVSVRFWQAIGRLRLAPLQILWTGDAFDQPFLAGLSDPAERAEIDLFMLQSDWHVATFTAHHRIPEAQIARTTLGAAATASADVPALAAPQPRPRRLAYASTPFRGLDVLLDVFPRIRAACPDAELEVFSSMRVYGVSATDDAQQFGALYRKARQPGVTLVGSVPQPELARRLQDVRVLAYPNHYAETFCIAAAEAQAAGCAVVTSALGALPETVGDAGVCVDGDPRSRGYQDAFVEACVSLLRDDDRWRETSLAALAQASTRYSWPGIAERWEATCRAALQPEPPELERIAVHLSSDRAPLAQRMLAKLARPASVPAAAWSALQALVAARAGAGAPPTAEMLRLTALHYRSIRRAGLLGAESASADRVNPSC
jgi:tetratricopeptide (TPR) repeat protein